MREKRLKKTEIWLLFVAILMIVILLFVAIIINQRMPFEPANNALFKKTEAINETLEKVKSYADRQINEITIKEEEYELDGGSIIISLSIYDEKYEISVICNANGEENASLIFAFFKAMLEKYESVIETTFIGVFCDNEKCAIYLASEGLQLTYGINRDGSNADTTPDWINTGLNASAEKTADYWTGIDEILTDFFK